MYSETSGTWDDLLAGSLSVVSTLSVFRGSETLVENLEITDGSITKRSDGRQIQQTLSVEVNDDLGTLLGGPESALMPLGQSIVVRAGLADKAETPTFVELLPLGTYGVDTPDTSSASPWRLYPGSGVFVNTGAIIGVQASDDLAQVGRENFVVPERPEIGATVRSETERLLQGIVGVASDWGPDVFPETTVPRSVTYDQSRLTTILNLAQMAGGVGWINRTGVYQVIKQVRRSTGVWTLAVGDPDDPEDTGAMVTWKPSVSRGDLYNGYVVRSEDIYGNPLQGAAYETDGPLRWGGPFGRVPFTEDNRLAKSTAGCQALAEAGMLQMMSSRSITVDVECLPNFALDPLDTIMLQVPNRTIPGLITSITYPLGQKTMKLQVSIPFTDWLVS